MPCRRLLEQRALELNWGSPEAGELQTWERAAIAAPVTRIADPDSKEHQTATVVALDCSGTDGIHYK